MLRSPGSIPVANSGQLLFVLRGANMQLTSDQAFSRLFAGTNYKVLDIIAKQKTGAASVACVGGIYDTAAKGGNAIVAAAQSWVTLAPNVTVTATLAAAAQTVLFANTLILSLTTGSTAACTADVFVFGYSID